MGKHFYSEASPEGNKKGAEIHRGVYTTDKEGHNEAGLVIDQTLHRKKADSRQMQRSTTPAFMT